VITDRASEAGMTGQDMRREAAEHLGGRGPMTVSHARLPQLQGSRHGQHPDSTLAERDPPLREIVR
jgi:hypothetical protein